MIHIRHSRFYAPLDVVTDDPVWADWSGAASPLEVNELLESLKLGFQEIPRNGLHLAAKAFLRYRRQGGTKISTLPDFFIGGHAEALGIPILTRDTARYQTYFPKVELISPPT